MTAALIALWVLAPRIACAIANANLPRELGPQATILSLSPTCDRLTTPPIHLAIAPRLMRRIAIDASGWWIPPGIIGHGLGAIGSLRGDGGMSIGWHAVASDGAEPPRLTVALSPAEADALIASAGGNRANAAGFRLTPRIAAAELSELPHDGPGRRFRIEASGSLRLHGNGLSLEVPVQRLAAQLAIEFLPAPTGWEPQIRVSVDALDAPLPHLPGVDASTWRNLLATAAENRITDALVGRTLPAWFPTDLRVSAVVR
jgi:hypothetical protein